MPNMSSPVSIPRTAIPGYWTSVRHELPPLSGDGQYSCIVQLAVAVDASPYPSQKECDADKVRYVTQYKSMVGRLYSPHRDVTHENSDTYHWRDIGSGQIIENVAFWAPLQAGPADLVLVGQQARLSQWHERGPIHVLSKLTRRVAVWFGAMPESNGRSNWTAMLYPEGGSLLDGQTIHRSELKDRVRYTADSLRHLIGETEDEPDILAYDGDLTGPAPADASIGLVGNEVLLRRLDVAMTNFGHLLEAAATRSDEEAWCVEARLQLQRVRHEIERRMIQAQKAQETQDATEAQQAQSS